MTGRITTITITIIIISGIIRTPHIGGLIGG
jgi:hypothetical protein